jgi:hypothetical protein
MTARTAAVNKWVKFKAQKIKAGLCLHSSCKRKHAEGVRCCKTHAAFYRERNRRYAQRIAKGLVKSHKKVSK